MSQPVLLSTYWSLIGDNKNMANKVTLIYFDVIFKIYSYGVVIAVVILYLY